MSPGTRITRSGKGRKLGLILSEDVMQKARDAASAEGKSLSLWLEEAAEEKLRKDAKGR